jgi:hypothetical protein
VTAADGGRRDAAGPPEAEAEGRDEGGRTGNADDAGTPPAEERGAGDAGTAGRAASVGSDDGGSTGDRPVVRVTRGLADVLLDHAASLEPEAANVVLGATPAGEFDADLGLDPEAPVLTHMYLPDAGRSVNAVFGMDLGTPAGRGRARFLSHPQGPFGVTERDDLAAVVLVAVPPWDDRSLGAFDRADRRLDLRIVDAEPPTESLDYSR